MNFEDLPTQEKEPKIPTKEQVLELIPNSEQGIVVRELSDEFGLYLLEVQFEVGDEKVEYSYTRKGSFPESKSLESRIDIAFLDEQGEPYAGEPFAVLNDEGDWRIL